MNQYDEWINGRLDHCPLCEEKNKLKSEWKFKQQEICTNCSNGMRQGLNGYEKHEVLKHHKIILNKLIKAK